MKKTDAAVQTLANINPDVEFEAYTYSITSIDYWDDFLARIKSGGLNGQPVDLVLGCVDNFEARIAINQVNILLSSFIDQNIDWEGNKGMCRAWKSLDGIRSSRKCSVRAHPIYSTWKNSLF